MNQKKMAIYFVFSVIMVDKESLYICSLRVSMRFWEAAPKESYSLGKYIKNKQFRAKVGKIDIHWNIQVHDKRLRFK